MKKLSMAFGILSMVLLLVGCGDATEMETGIPVNEVQKKRNPDDPFLSELYWELNRTPMQERLRNIKPFPVGVVYYQQRDENMDSAKKEFRVIHDLGFTALKQIELRKPDNPSNYREQVYHAALDEGLSPWYYGRGGWAEITQELVDELGIDMEVSKENMPAIQNDPRMLAYQTNQVIRPRIARRAEKKQKIEEFLEKSKQRKGEPGRNSPWLPERLIPAFADWLKDTYGTIDVLKEAWNEGFIPELDGVNSFMDAANLMKGEGYDEYGNLKGNKSHDFRRFRDAMRFQASLIVKNYELLMEFLTQWDSIEPERTGGHQLFENQAANTWDLEGQAKAAAEGGSFYASIHLPHHFFLVDGEITKPVYMQARTISDVFKGGWAATWESAGGPTFYSGYHPAKHDGKVMRQLMCSYIAAGLKGVGIWMWNSRAEGWEVGEYALCDIQGNPSERAVEAGRIAGILQEQRFELWESMDEPAVGLLYSWETEAMLGRLSLGAYPLDMFVYETDHDRQFRQYHAQARIGVARALMNNHVPYENVTERDLAAGLADRYPIIFLPYTLTLDKETISILEAYVKEGGRLVADFSLLKMDTYGRLNKQPVGSYFEQLFGFIHTDYYHTFHHSKYLLGEEFDNTGYGDLKVTTAKVEERFDDGTPAVLNHAFGEGSVTYFNFEAGRFMFEPGHEKIENFVVQHTLGNYRVPFKVSGAEGTMVFRRSAPDADHYIFINEGEEEQVQVSSDYFDYVSAIELIEEENLNVNNSSFSVTVPAYSALWVRAVKE